MSISYRIDRDAQLARAEIVGPFAVDDIVRCVTDASRSMAGTRWHIVTDHRAAGEAATRAQLERLVDHLYDLRLAVGGARWATVVAEPASFGMMRMFSVLAEAVPMTVRVFLDRDAADAWARAAIEPPPAAVDPPHW